MANQYVNKVVVNSADNPEAEVKLDLTEDTVEASKVASGVTFHDKTGAQQTGSMAEIATFKYLCDSDTGEQTYTWQQPGEMQTDKTRYSATLTDPQYIEFDRGLIEWTDDMYGTARIDIVSSGTSYTLEDNDAGGQTLTIG